ncbi:hypothetical protein EP7_002789 [Isosphaeraceae bacterium EP7]
MAEIRLHVVVEYEGRTYAERLTRPASARLDEVVREVLRQHGLWPDTAAWVVRFGREVLDWGQTVDGAIPGAADWELIRLDVRIRPGGEPLPSPEINRPDTPPARGPIRVPPLQGPPAPAVPPFLAPPMLVSPASPLPPSGLSPEIRVEPPAPEVPAVRRLGTVRYFRRMNPDRLFPLRVIVSKDPVEAIDRAGVDQRTADPFDIAIGSDVEVEPILPGCDCYPPRMPLRIEAGDVEATFWVTPKVVGDIEHAQVVIRQGGVRLAAIPLQIQVRRPRAAIVAASLAVVLPFGQALLRLYRLDFESQAEQGFSIYGRLLRTAASSLSPELLAVGLFAAAALLYARSRPRSADAFWEPPRPVA